MIVEENLERKIKKNIYGKSQIARVIFPAGFGATALDETKQILSDLWFPQKFNSVCSLLKSEIRIENIHMFSLTEILMRNQCLTDIRLVIFEGKAVGKEAFEKHCKSMNWNFYLNTNMSIKIKVDSVASKAFHETGLKEILSKIVKEHVSEIVSGENTEETTCLFADLYKDKLTLSISIAGDLLYKRGYRGKLSASAPLREDYAASCIQKAFQFAEKVNSNFSADSLFIPFSGTGTFAFEYLHNKYKLAPALSNRKFALQKMPLYRQENFLFLIKKAKENSLFNQNNNLNILCIDNSKNANDAFLENANNFKNTLTSNEFILPNNLFNSDRKSFLMNENFLKLDFSKLNLAENLFIPLNPPYGIRIGSNSDSAILYKNIASKLNEISKITKKSQKNILGFILCPTEDSWSAFSRNLTHTEIETYHFTQGGMDIRVCQFYI